MLYYIIFASDHHVYLVEGSQSRSRGACTDSKIVAAHGENSPPGSPHSPSTQVVHGALGGTGQTYVDCPSAVPVDRIGQAHTGHKKSRLPEMQ